MFSPYRARLRACLELSGQLRTYCLAHSLPSYDVPHVQISAEKSMPPLEFAADRIRGSESLSLLLRHDTPEWQELWLKSLLLRSGIYVALAQLSTLEHSVAILCRSMVNMRVGTKCVHLLKLFNAAGAKIIAATQGTGLLAVAAIQEPDGFSRSVPLAELANLMHEKKNTVPERFGINEAERTALLQELDTTNQHCAVGIDCLVLLVNCLNASLPKIISFEHSDPPGLDQISTAEALRGISSKTELVLTSTEQLGAVAAQIAASIMRTHTDAAAARPLAAALSRVAV